jgi:hypothetical protein
MVERPIIFSGPMVRAILDGRKTQTRRVCKLTHGGHLRKGKKRWHPEDPEASKGCPYAVGDRLWVKETWAAPHAYDGHEPGEIGRNGCTIHYGATENLGGLLARSSIHMPRWAGRITLVVTDIRVQRVQDISEADAIAEGVDTERYVPVSDSAGMHSCGEAEPTDPINEYRDIWTGINGDGAWNDNPWVVAITFERAA